MWVEIFFFFCYGYSIARAQFVGKVILPFLFKFFYLSFLKYSCTFVKNKLNIFMSVFFWVLESVLLICVSVHPPIL